ncbi:MAG: galactokinase [Cardiobacteriaceae bacterium]|nr:galactokinase [Cardiobacteriaceae bacterium]
MFDTARLFINFFQKEPAFTVRAPGRVNLIGEHTDYNDGFVLPCAINFATEVSIAPRADTEIHIVAADYENARDNFSAAVSPVPHSQGWTNYVRGVANVFMQRFGAFAHGFDMVISGNVPQGAGLSSSASLEVAIGKTLQTLYHFDASHRDIALLGQQAENQFVGCQCGIMDQFISAMGEYGQALLIDCRSLETENVALPEGLQVMIVNSNVQRGLVGSEYNTRRAQCETAAAYFQAKALRDINMQQLQSAEKALDNAVYRRARHVISENERVLAAVSALRSNNIPLLSTLMAQSHASMRDDFAITVPPIDALVDIMAGVIGSRGGVRMTGGGFGGCVVALVPQDLLHEVQTVITREYPQQSGLQADIYLCHAENGVHLVS